MIDLNPFRRRLSRRLVRAASHRDPAAVMTVRELTSSLGDRSFGWCLVVFALVNLIPMPPGINFLTAAPLVLLTAQMAIGLEQVWLPGFLAERAIGRKGFQKVVMRLRPLIRPIERIVRPRALSLFHGYTERAIGLFLFAVALALLVPVPITSYIPALALFVSGIGIVERDGYVLIGGLTIGAFAIVITLFVVRFLLLGAHVLTH